MSTTYPLYPLRSSVPGSRPGACSTLQTDSAGSALLICLISVALTRAHGQFHSPKMAKNQNWRTRSDKPINRGGPQKYFVAGRPINARTGRFHGGCSTAPSRGCVAPALIGNLHAKVGRQRAAIWTARKSQWDEFFCVFWRELRGPDESGIE
jgi:hypothetical protein